MFTKDVLIANELKHLSAAYRNDTSKMDDLLHEDFHEVGASGKSYDKQAILKAMPLAVVDVDIEDFRFDVTGHVVTTHYTLVENKKAKSVCESRWLNTSLGLKLVFFKRVKSRKLF